MEIKKYELTDETVPFCGKDMHRIRALIDIPSNNVKAGDFGGYIEKEENLSKHVSGPAQKMGWPSIVIFNISFNLLESLDDIT